MLSRRPLVLPQSKVPEFVDSPWEVLPSLRSGWGWRGRKEGVAGGGKGVVTRIGIQKEKRLFLKEII